MWRNSAYALLVALAVHPAYAGGPSICIRSYEIDQTEIKDDSTILFHMRDGSTYRNDLAYRCGGLKAATDGIIYEPTDPATDELCGNLGSFRVNEGDTGPGPVCLFGPFTKLK